MQKNNKKETDLFLKKINQSPFSKTCPYVIMSREEYKLAAQTIAQVGLSEFFESLRVENYKSWMASAFMQTKYPEDLSNCRLDYLRSETSSIIEYMKGML
ncbi:hypothetical protein [Pseudomonas fluorescens]|uniref:hypothetical protein n=1 Tax=Pseudomonas fluorescens TaxID=294 RepID=UPI001269D1D0|nr:hypothetical protein [Pseudomonas fluorescens]